LLAAACPPARWRSKRWRSTLYFATLCLAGALSGCSAGIGDGSVMGAVWAPECGLAGEPYDLRPNFFSADPTLDFLDIRVQRGSDFEDVSDGMGISVRSASEVAANIGTPIELHDPLNLPRVPPDERPLAAMSVYLNDACPIDRDTIPVAYQAVSGSLTFDAIFAPMAPTTDLEITGRFTDVRFEDPSAPGTRYATLSGFFSFIFNRGRPAQRFP